MLPDMKPEQLKTVVGSTEPAKKEFLFYRQNEIITVLDKCTNSPYWKGVLNSGKTGLFNPANTVTYLGSLPSSTNRDSFSRSSDRSSKRKLRTEMISRPQNDLKHTGHVGLDGAYFGDIAFMSSVQNVSFFLLFWSDSTVGTDYFFYYSTITYLVKLLHRISHPKISNKLHYCYLLHPLAQTHYKRLVDIFLKR